MAIPLFSLSSVSLPPCGRNHRVSVPGLGTMVDRKRDKLKAFGQKLNPWHKKKSNQENDLNDAVDSMADETNALEMPNQGTNTNNPPHSPETTNQAENPSGRVQAGKPNLGMIIGSSGQAKVRHKRVKRWIGEQAMAALSSTGAGIEAKPEKATTDSTE